MARIIVTSGADVPPPSREKRPRPKRQRVQPPKRFFPWSLVPAGRRILTTSHGWTTRVYALVDPRDDGVRYVGMTSGETADRLARHLEKPTNDRMAEWLRELTAAGALPRIELLTWACDRAPGNQEMEWVAWFRTRGDLLNKDPGGRYRDEKGKPKRAMKAVAGMVRWQVGREVHEGVYFASHEKRKERMKQRG